MRASQPAQPYFVCLLLPADDSTPAASFLSLTVDLGLARTLPASVFPARADSFFAFFAAFLAPLAMSSRLGRVESRRAGIAICPYGACERQLPHAASHANTPIHAALDQARFADRCMGQS